MRENALASVMLQPNQEFETRKFPLPNVEPKGALAKIEMAGICGTDIHIWRGRRRVPLPIILGHEGIGRIYRLGEKLKIDSAGRKLNEGDRVVWSVVLTCDECYGCVIEKDQAACLNRKLYGYMSCEKEPYLNGTFSTHIYLRPGSVVFRIPEELSNEALVPLSCALSVAYHSVERANTKVGMDIVIQGTGPVGLYCTAFAKEIGAKTIIVGQSPIRLELARLFGVDHIIDRSKISTPDERIDVVKEITYGKGADIVFECTGSPSVIPEGIEMCKRLGKYVLVGTASEDVGTVPIDPSKVTLKALTLMGLRAYEPVHLLRAIEFLHSKAEIYPFEKVITDKFTLHEVTKALRKYEKREGVKAAVIP